jgi:hypothetical protein
LFSRLFKSNQYLKQLILWIILFICLLLIAGPLAFHISYAVPAVKTRNIAAHLFSEERAREYLTNLTAYGTRVSYTHGNLDARDYLFSQIKSICSMSKRYSLCEIEFQNFSINYNQLQNVLVRISNPVTRYKNVSSLMLNAHFDSGKCV